MLKAKFPLGDVMATPGALGALKRTKQSIFEFVYRHAQGDWGELSEQDRQENELSLRESLRLMSVYRLNEGTKIWIITEADRSVTTVLLPDEY